MKTNARNYNVKDVNLMIAADTIVSHAINHKEFLQSKRAVWADPFFEDFQTRINNAIQTYLGADNAAQLRQSTQKVHEIMRPVRVLLSEVKVQIEEDFRQEPEKRDEILNTLGFTTFYSALRKDDQEAAIELLYRFSSNLTKDIRNDIVNAGTAASTLDEIISYADALRAAEVKQEANKGNRKILTVEAVTEFNAIYDQLRAINRIASRFFAGDKPKQALFSFSKTTKSLGSTPIKKKDPA
ncbi:hypothetical protein [Flavobacterium sp.]|uniref:hypothetical protein n=1 Tax=Flavobacterium sp. TaxID=239 RepID=UPI0026244516|nr:hypothetical protein [Flavobacterium sp.]